MTYSRMILKGTTIVFILTVIGTIIGYVLRLFIAHNLTVAEYGMFYGVMAFVGMFSILRDLGLNAALVKFIPEFIIKNEYWKIKSSIVMITLVETIVTGIVMGTIILLSDTIALDVFGNLDASIVIKLIAASTFVSIFFHIIQSVFQGFQKPLLYSSMDVARTATVFIFSMVLIGMGAFGISIAYVIAPAIIFLIYFAPFLRLPVLRGVAFSKSVVKPILSFASPIFAGGLISIAMNYIDTVLLTLLSGVYFTGLYQAALPTSQLLFVFPSSIAAVAFPLFSEMWARGEKDKIGTGLGYIIVILFLIVIPVIAGVFALANNIIILLFGGEFFGAITILRILIISSFFYTLYFVFTTSLQSIGKPLLYMKILCLMAGSTIALNLLLIPVWQGVGTAIALTVAYFIGFILVFYELRKFINIRILYSKIAKIIFSSLVMLAAIFFVKEILVIDSMLLEAVISAFTGMVVYTTMIIYTRAVSKQDIELLRNMGIGVPAIVGRILR